MPLLKVISGPTIKVKIMKLCTKIHIDDAYLVCKFGHDWISGDVTITRQLLKIRKKPTFRVYGVNQWVQVFPGLFKDEFPKRLRDFGGF